jgi:hydrogenase maturation protease
VQGKNKNIIVVGIGNTLMGDDGIGACICKQIGISAPPHVTTLVTHQLQIELAATLSIYTHIVFADAAIGRKEIIFSPLQRDTPPVSSSHHVNAVIIAALIKELYHANPHVMLCEVPGFNFEHGEVLSPAAKKNAAAAAALIQKWVSEI